MSAKFQIAALIIILLAYPAAAQSQEAPMRDLLAYDQLSASGGWERWFPRQEVAPSFVESADGGGTLVVEGAGVEYCIGGWQRTVSDLKPGEALQLRAEVECSGVANPPRSLWIRIYWQGDLPEGTAPDVPRLAAAGENLYVFDDRIEVPTGAESALVRLIYRWDGDGRAVWRNISMKPAGPEKPHRVVRISTLYWRPKEKATLESNFNHWLELIDVAAADKPDLILISEGAMIVGVGFKDMDALSEELPGGRFFKGFAAKAKEHSLYVCYGTYEREGRYIYNTAVLVGPDGKLIGKYRKSHLPIEEDIAGLAPGNSIDVFETPIGRIGMNICIESAFPEVMRATALKGAEIVLLPIWGGDEQTVQIRAKENGVYVVTAAYDMKSMIVDPRGNILAETGKGLGNGIATAECDLDDRTKEPWMGNWRSYMMRMRWEELYDEITGRE